MGYNPVRECVYGFQSIGYELNEFLWEGKPLKSLPEIHTIEEYHSKLESIRQRCFEYFDEAKDDIF